MRHVSKRRLMLVVAALALAACRRPESGTPAPAAALVQARRADATPRRLPTIAAIDWAAFPRAVAEPRGRSGRVVRLRPGAPAVVARALESAAPGDTLLLEPGTYTEGMPGDYRGLVMDKEGLVLRAVGGRARIVPAAGIKRGLMVEASQITVQGLDLEGFKDAGVSLGKEGETLRQIVLTDISVKGGPDDGIVAYPDHRASGKPVIDGMLLRNVRVEGAALGISCNGGPCRSWWLENVDVINASGSGSGADTIGVESGENFVLVNVTVTGAAADGIDIKAPRVLLQGCHVHHVRRNGIKLWRGGDIVNTVVHHSGADAAVVFNGPGRYRVLHSLVAYHNYNIENSYCLTAGVDVKEPLDVQLLNTIFHRTAGGLYLSAHTRAQIQGCLFHDMQNPTAIRRIVGGTEEELRYVELVAAIERAGIGSGNVAGKDPRFVDAERGDFRLLPGEGRGCGRAASPIPDGGRATPLAPETDFLGRRRAQGAAPDIGPFEWR